MKTIIIALLAALCLIGCVQPTYKRTVKINLLTPNKTNIKTVGVRGNDQPLSWKQDLPMQTVVKDSLYTLTVTANTGYKFAEVKFTINDTFELEGQPNRRIYFNEEKDTTQLTLIFNKQ